MSQAMRLIVFDVDHGFSAFILAANGYTHLIDLGRTADFSPLDYLKQGYLKERRLGRLFVTHAHGDHLEDVFSLTGNASPGWLNARKDYDWNELRGKERKEKLAVLDEYIKLRTQVYTGTSTDYPDWGLEVSSYGFSPAEAKSRFSEARHVNNSSKVLVASWRGFKFVVPGDIEREALESLCQQTDFRNAAKGADLYLAPHHGHRGSFTSEIFKVMGRPYVNIVSIRSRDEHYDSRYSQEAFARGWTVNGENRYCLTTRNDGTIAVDMTAHNDGRLTMAINSYDLR